jgi:hypothetical protein
MYIYIKYECIKDTIDFQSINKGKLEKLEKLEKEKKAGKK